MATIGETVQQAPVFEESRPSRTRRYWAEFRRWPVIPAAIVLFILFIAIFAPLLAPHDPEQGNLRERNTPPAWEAEGTTKYLLGTDPQGRDMLSRLIYGARISLMVAAIVLTGGVVGGTLVGLVAGWYGGNIDEALMRFVDFTFAIPFILVALVVVIVLGQSLTVIILLLVIFSWNSFARQIRAEALKLKTEAYIEAAQIAGASTSRIFIRHLVPGILSTLMVMTSLRVGGLILTESVLSFLGVGIPPPTPAWGVMVAAGRTYVETAWWVSLFPGLAIMMVVISFNFLGDWLRDFLDPRLRQVR